MSAKMGGWVYLRAMEPSDLMFLNQLHNDDEINQNTGGNKYFVSSEYDRKWLDDKMLNTQKQIYLMICLKEDNKSIGYLSLTNIDHLNKKATLNGYTISAQYQGHGYATEAMKLMVQYAFDELNMNRIEIAFLDRNEISFHIGKKCGYTQEGLLRNYIYKRGCYHDVRLCSILRSDYERLKKEGVYPIG